MTTKTATGSVGPRAQYFSRVVKKKLLALADPDVQRLALKALQ